MAHNIDLFQLTQLAEASYADLWNPVTQLPYTTVIDIQKKLRELGTPIIKDQAQLLTDHWSVTSHQRNTSNGFSATLFQSKDDSNKYVLAMRGTEPTWNQIIPDLGVTDLLDIVGNGLAMDQIVDMYNYWQQLNAPKNTAYQVAVLETLTQETINYNLAKLGKFVPGANMAADQYIAYLHSGTYKGQVYRTQKMWYSFYG